MNAQTFSHPIDWTAEEQLEAQMSPQQLLLYWQHTDAQLDVVKAREMRLRQKAFKAFFPNAEEGTNTFELPKGWKLKGKRVINYTLDKNKSNVSKTMTQISQISEEAKIYLGMLFEPKISFMPGAYKDLNLSNDIQRSVKALVDTILTTKDGAPTLEVVPPKD